LKLRLALIGFGNVGREFVRLLLSKRDWLSREQQVDFEVAAIATRTRGSLISKGAIDLERAIRMRRDSGTLLCYGPESTNLSTLEIIESCDADLMVELTTLNIESGQPAIDYIKAAFRTGKSVITANKGPVAFEYNTLSSMARKKGVFFRFEGTVMDGTPVFSFVEKTLPGCEIIGIKGLLNSTTNFVLGEMERGKSMSEALKVAKRLGITEEDPTMDIDGWDAAVKITALANVLMDARSNPNKVDRVGIGEMTFETVMEAVNKNKKPKLIASAERFGAEVKIKVFPGLVGPDHIFWSVDGTSSAISLETDLMGEITIIERNPTPAQTAYAIFSDMLLMVDSMKKRII